MEPSLTVFAVLSPTWASLASDVAGVVAFGASLAVLIATEADEGSRTLSRVRAACVALTGLVVATSFLAWPSPWAQALSCVGFLISALAVALAFARVPSLRSYAERRATGADPGWWDEFERDFRRHARRPVREQNPLRGAVARRQAPSAGEVPMEGRDESSETPS